MGKVGSSSLESSINGSYHLHSLFNNPPNPLHWELRNFGLKKRMSIYIRNFFRRTIFKTGKSIKIITIVRPAMERNISMFFQALPFWLSVAQSGFKCDSSLDARREGFDVLIDSFENYYSHDYCLKWFENEIERFSGINVYSQPFNQDTGYTIFKNGRYECLVMSLNKLTSNTQIISEFIGENITLNNENSGDKKWYADIYKRFRKEYEPSEKLKTKITNSKYTKHFFK
jgi:hypothetical protein